MNRSVQQAPRRRWPAYLLLLFSALALYQFSGYEALSELRAAWQRERELQQEIQGLRQENAQIEAGIKELSPQGSQVERIAREEMGWAKPGEIVVKIPEKK